MLTLTDVVTAVRSLKRLSRVTRAAAKLHFQTAFGDPKHGVVSYVGATEAVEGEPGLQKTVRQVESAQMLSVKQVQPHTWLRWPSTSHYRSLSSPSVLTRSSGSAVLRLNWSLGSVKKVLKWCVYCFMKKARNRHISSCQYTRTSTLNFQVQEHCGGSRLG